MKKEMYEKIVAMLGLSLVIILIILGLFSSTPQFGSEDNDNDGLPDAWEIRYFQNLDQEANNDPDGDSVNNLNEYNQGTIPTDPTDATPQPPNANDDVYIIPGQDPSALFVLSNDIDPNPANIITITSSTNPAHGTITRDDALRKITYQANAGYSGSDSFTYTISDATFSDTATVSLQIKPDSATTPWNWPTSDVRLDTSISDIAMSVYQTYYDRIFGVPIFFNAVYDSEVSPTYWGAPPGFHGFNPLTYSPPAWHQLHIAAYRTDVLSHPGTAPLVFGSYVSGADCKDVSERPGHGVENLNPAEAIECGPLEARMSQLGISWEDMQTGATFGDGRYQVDILNPYVRDKWIDMMNQEIRKRALGDATTLPFLDVYNAVTNPNAKPFMFLDGIRYPGSGCPQEWCGPGQPGQDAAWKTVTDTIQSRRMSANALNVKLIANIAMIPFVLGPHQQNYPLHLEYLKTAADGFNFEQVFDARFMNNKENIEDEIFVYRTFLDAHKSIIVTSRQTLDQEAYIPNQRHLAALTMMFRNQGDSIFLARNYFQQEIPEWINFPSTLGSATGNYEIEALNQEKSQASIAMRRQFTNGRMTVFHPQFGHEDQPLVFDLTQLARNPSNGNWPNYAVYNQPVFQDPGHPLVLPANWAQSQRIVYTPKQDYSGVDFFTLCPMQSFEICGTTGKNKVFVRVYIEPAPDAPVINSVENENVNVDISDNDPSPVHITGERGQPMNFHVKASDTVDEDAQTRLRIIEPLPYVISFQDSQYPEPPDEEADYLFSWNPNQQYAGTWSLTVEAYDGSNSQEPTDRHPIEIFVSHPTFRAPVLSEILPYIGPVPPLSWTASNGAGRYEIQHSADPTFTSNVVTEWSTSTSATITPTQSGTYYARVRGWTYSSYAAHQGIASPWSNVIQFPVDRAPPTGSVLINQGATETNNRQVTLTVSAADPSTVLTVAFSNNRATWSQEFDYGNINFDWMLAEGVSGTRTVYARFTDSAGNPTTEQITDTIYYTSSYQPLTPNAGPDQTRTDTNNNGVEQITLSGSVSGGSAPFRYAWYENGQILSKQQSFTRNFPVGVHIVTLRVWDSIGTTSSDNVQITVYPSSGQPPGPIQVNVEPS